ncbi:Na+ dependent nucleoside transporter C-terminus-domain-containing protein [Sporodiniella umbellata]|nr:Na+ dependent nucleoside transporter C-terminus-domain-containing protein [Sporodiniella umbellata]
MSKENELPISRIDTGATNIDTRADHNNGSSDLKGSSTAIDIPPTTNEKVYDISTDEDEEQSDDSPGFLSRIYNKYRMLFHLAYFLIFTGFLAAAYALQLPKGYSQENLILGLIYAFFVLKIAFNYIPTTVYSKPWMYCVHTIAKPIRMIPHRVLCFGYAFLVFAVIAATVFSLPETAESTRLQRLVSLFGIFVFFAGLYLSSTNRRAINWNTVLTGILVQFILALFVFRCSVGHDIFQWASSFAQGYLEKATRGTAFVFGETVANSGIFAVAVFPTLIFFAATVQVLYYINALQWVLQKCAVFFMAIMQVSGAESVVAVASPFLGQGENALLIKPFLPYLTPSEMHQVMCSGFATISGSVLYGYIAMGVSGEALLTSCIMSIPCSLAVSKMRVPETRTPMTAKTISVPPSDDRPTNLLHAAGLGAATGVHIVLLMMANLISLLALLYAVNAGLTWIGNFLNIHELTLQLITGYLFVPVAWLIGIENKDVVTVGQILATKIWANEFVAFEALASTYKGVLSPRSLLITTYAVCGFANLGSVGMQIGILGTMAPKRTGEIARLAVSAMMCGAMCTFISAAIAGMLN